MANQDPFANFQNPWKVALKQKTVIGSLYDTGKGVLEAAGMLAEGIPAAVVAASSGVAAEGIAKLHQILYSGDSEKGLADIKLTPEEEKTPGGMYLRALQSLGPKTGTQKTTWDVGLKEWARKVKPAEYGRQTQEDTTNVLRSIGIPRVPESEFGKRLVTPPQIPEYSPPHTVGEIISQPGKETTNYLNYLGAVADPRRLLIEAPGEAGKAAADVALTGGLRPYVSPDTYEEVKYPVETLAEFGAYGPAYHLGAKGIKKVLGIEPKMGGPEAVTRNDLVASAKGIRKQARSEKIQEKINQGIADLVRDAAGFEEQKAASVVMPQETRMAPEPGVNVYPEQPQEPTPAPTVEELNPEAVRQAEQIRTGLGAPEGGQVVTPLDRRSAEETFGTGEGTYEGGVYRPPIDLSNLPPREELPQGVVEIPGPGKAPVVTEPPIAVEPPVHPEQTVEDTGIFSVGDKIKIADGRAKVVSVRPDFIVVQKGDGTTSKIMSRKAASTPLPPEQEPNFMVDETGMNRVPPANLEWGFGANKGVRDKFFGKKGERGSFSWEKKKREDDTRRIGSAVIDAQKKIEAGMDITTVKARMLKDIIGYDPTTTVVGELLQNSLDATRENNGKINVIADYEGGIEVWDSGTGMTPEVLKKNFVTVGKQGTKGEKDIGGFGIANLPIMGWPDSFDIVSVADIPGKGRYESRVWGNRDEFMQDHHVNYESKKLTGEDRNKQTGTIVKLNKEGMTNFEAKYAVRAFTSSLRVPIDVNFFAKHSDRDIILEETYKGKSVSDLPDRHDVMNLNVPGGSKVSVKFVPVSPYGHDLFGNGYTIRTRVYNKGLLLPDLSEHTAAGAFSLSKKPNFELEVHFTETPAASDAANYPFISNRTRLSPEVEKVVVDAISKKIGSIEGDIRKSNIESLQEVFTNAPEFGNTKVITTIKEPELRNRILDVINYSKDVFTSLGSIYKSFGDLLQTRTGVAEHTFVITTDPRVHGFRPKSGLLDKDYIAVNPFSYYEPDLSNPSFDFEKLQREAGTALIDTMLHEAAHANQSGHGKAYVQEFHRLTKLISHNLLAKLEDIAYDFFRVHGENLEGAGRDIAEIQSEGTKSEIFSDYTPEQRVGEKQTGSEVYVGGTGSTGKETNVGPINASEVRSGWDDVVDSLKDINDRLGDRGSISFKPVKDFFDLQKRSEDAIIRTKKLREDLGFVTKPVVKSDDWYKRGQDFLSKVDDRRSEVSVFVQNTLQTLEDIGRTAGPGGAETMKELFRYPLDEANVRALYRNLDSYLDSRAIRETLPGNSPKRIFLYALSQEKGGIELLDSLRTKMAESLVGKVTKGRSRADKLNIPELTPKEMEAYIWLKKEILSSIPELNRARELSGKKPFDAVENPFSYARDYAIASLTGKEPKSATELKKNELDAFAVFDLYMQSVAKGIELTPEINAMRKLITKEFRESHPNTARVLDDYLNYASGRVKREWPAGIERFISKLQSNIVYATLSANARVSLIQLTSLVQSASELGLKYTGIGLKDWMVKGVDEALAKSNKLATREHDLDVKYKLGGFIGKLGKARQAFNQSWFGLGALKYVDFQTAVASWYGAYSKAKFEFGFDEQKAVRYADDTITRTQASAERWDVAPVQRTTFGRMFTTFQTFAIQNFNWIARDVLGIKNPDISNKVMVEKVTRLLLGGLIVNSLFDFLGVQSPLPQPYNAARDEYDKSGSIPKALGMAALEMGEVLPGFGGRRYGSHPLGATVQFLGDVSAALDGGAPKWTGLGKTSPAVLVGKALGIPGTTQAAKTQKQFFPTDRQTKLENNKKIDQFAIDYSKGDGNALREAAKIMKGLPKEEYKRLNDRFFMGMKMYQLEERGWWRDTSALRPEERAKEFYAKFKSSDNKTRAYMIKAAKSIKGFESDKFNDYLEKEIRDNQ